MRGSFFLSLAKLPFLILETDFLVLLVDNETRFIQSQSRLFLVDLANCHTFILGFDHHLVQAHRGETFVYMPQAQFVRSFVQKRLLAIGYVICRLGRSYKSE